MTTDASGADLLATIVAATRRSVDVRADREPLDRLRTRAAERTVVRHRFSDALSGSGLNVIAECKRRSPSKGVLRAHYDPVAIARGYADAGAAAISVLTEPTFFDGSLDHLEAVRSAVGVPLLRKDFIVSEYQIVEARAAGADAVLLIVAALTRADLLRLMASAMEQSLDVLVEVHDDRELDEALGVGARLVGVNNRNLRTLAVDVGASERLIGRMPADIVAVSESGLRTADDLIRLSGIGYRAFLIGERFMTEAEPGEGVRRLLGAARARGGAGEVGIVLIEICGLTRHEDATLAVSLGARAIGFVFWPDSPRYVAPDRAREIIRDLPPFVTPVGVFVNQTASDVNTIADRVGLGAVQLHGDEAVAEALDINRPVLKAVTAETAAQAALDWPARVVLLIDAHDRQRRGGTGQTVDWSVAASLASRRPTMLAGGLRPENVADAIARVHPFGIDVSSGVETSPGLKDHQRMKALFDAVSFAVTGS